MSEERDLRTRLRVPVRLAGYATAVLLTLFGVLLASFSGFLMPSQMRLYITFDYWEGIGVAVSGALGFLSILVLRRSYAWLLLAIAGVGLAVLQLARFAVFGTAYIDTDWWVIFTAEVVAALAGFFAVRLRA